MREYPTGATRDDADDKLDYEGSLSPWVLERYVQYMHENRIQADGKPRTSDNWQKGIPEEDYIQSTLRHVMASWFAHRGDHSRAGEEEALCGILFNVMGKLHEILKRKRK